MEDQDTRVKFLEQSLIKAETRAQEASSNAALVREQLERAHHDKRALAAQHERAASTERELRLQVAELNTARETERRKIRQLEAAVMESEAETRVSKLRIETLESTLASAEAETKWYCGELDRRSVNARTKARDFTTKLAELETLLDQAQAERDALKRQVAALQTSYKSSQEQLERAQHKTRTLKKELEATETDAVYGGGSILLERGMAALQAEIEASHIQEKQLQDRFTEISRAYNEACDKIEEQRTQLRDMQGANAEHVKQVSQLENENAENKNSLSRLARQIHHLLINAQLAADSEPLLTPEEKIELSKAQSAPHDSGSPAMDVIMDRLGYFKDVGELLQQNEMQLRVLDSLTAKCEKYEAQESVENTAVTDAKETIISLNNLVKDLQKERDVLRASQLTVATEPKVHDASFIEDRVSVIQTDLDLAKSTAASLQTQLSSVLESSANATQRAAILSQDLANTREIAEQLRVEKSRLESQSKLLESQFSTQQCEISELHLQRNALNADFTALREQLAEKDRTLNTTQTRLLDQVDSLRSQLSSMRHELTESESQIKLYASQKELANKNAETFNNELIQSKMAYDNLSHRCESLEKELEQGEERLRLRTISFTTADSDKVSQLEGQLDQFDAQIKDLRSLVSEKQKELDASNASFETQKKELETQLQAVTQTLENVSNELNTLKNTPPDTTELDAATAELLQVKQALDKVRNDADKAAADARESSKAEADKYAALVSDTETKISSIQVQVSSLEAEKQKLSSEIAYATKQHEDSVATLTKQCAALDSTVTALRIENSELVANKELLLEQLQATVKLEVDETEQLSADASTSEGTTPLINMLKRDKQIATVLLQNSEAKAHELEVKVQVLQESLSKAESELASVSRTTSTGESAGLNAELEQSNTQLVSQLKEVSDDRGKLQAQLTAAQQELELSQSKVRSLEATTATLSQEIELVKADRDVWKSRIGGTNDENLSALQKQLEEKESLLERTKQEYTAKLEQESQKGKLAMSQVMQLNSKIQELSKASDSKNNDEIVKKDERISYLENEINRISDELTEEEQKKKELSDKVATQESKLQQISTQLKAAKEKAANVEASQAAAAANADAEKRIKELEAEIVSKDLKIQSLNDLNTKFSEDNAGTTPDDLQKLVEELSAKTTPEEVTKLQDLIANTTRDRIKAKTAAFVRNKTNALNEEKEVIVKERDALAAELAEVKQSITDIETKAAKRFELKTKILQGKADNYQKTNEELKLTIRKLKGGDNNVKVLTLPDGTTKVASDNAAPQQSQRPQHQNQNQQKRPQVQRNGTKVQKRNNHNDDNDLNKRLREN